MAKNPVLTPSQVARVKKEVSAAPKGERYRTFFRLGDEFGCSWRTVQNAAYGKYDRPKAEGAA